ncbi:MAG: tetratricopeptide repeat protein [Gemmatimonadales bacterium]|nr:tetratricopeptide repeat protein [Gemmatimonadales bacterium]NIN13065.1 tetratricopeptide repeat protein [Gemmatimonadales bacterium]NIN51149.1 tetratricopeptide repeat protein [Gemmatimonadales bacterium]NIP08613.1 tetratricopeptide repeat protein [Gemmatimonadales bacterium]NIR02301.1 tetratricopeptide repeat protein [Gemmatimonadales bacterium]
MRVACAITLLVLCSISASRAAAQSYEEHMARGDSLRDALKPAEALEEFRAAFFANQTYEASWKFARAQVDVAKQIEENGNKDLRDSLYWVAKLYAEAAIRKDSTDPEGQFMLANALGRLSRTRGGKERVRFAREIYDLASRALELDPDHDGAEHVIGAWHAEIMRLSGLTKFFAKTFLGAGFMNRASWDSAVVHLEHSVRLKPDYLYHRLELAEVYVDLKRWDDARTQLEEIGRLAPTSDVMDHTYKEEALRLLAEIREEAEQ